MVSLFAQEYPNVPVKIQISVPDRLLEDLEKGELDIAYHYAARVR
jgi:DNA-binding transcriptional LysR family regulator